MIIKIYDDHQHSGRQLSKNNIILGVHSFTHLLNSIHKSNLSILLHGNITSIMQHVLWNQFYAHTLLKDIHKILSVDNQTKNNFIKIGGVTYHLSECLEWQNARKFKNELLKYPSFCIQSFLEGGKIRYFNIEIGQPKFKKFDLIFHYKHESLNSSQIFYDTSKSKKKNFSTITITKTHNKYQPIRNSIATKSLFEANILKQRQQQNLKFLTQKKRNQSVAKKTIKISTIDNKIQQKQRKSKSRSKKVSYQNKQNQQQMQVAIIAQGPNINNFISKTQINDPQCLKKEELVATLLSRKEQKIREYRNALQQQEMRFEQKLQQMQISHQQEVANIKYEVSDILSTYKLKNRQLRKQNKCLIQVNEKLTLANKKHEATLQQVHENMKNLIEKQQFLQKINHQYNIKLENVEKTNSILNERINEQVQNYQSQLCIKDKQLYQIKSKYQRLVGSLKMATSQTQKQI